MRRTYISSEYIQLPTFGTFNMVEEANYFGSKMLEIEDTLYIDIQNLIYFQKSNGEQLDLESETSLPSFSYSAVESKKLYHSLVLDEAQNNFQKENNTNWILNIDLKDILTEFIFATLKRYRTFEGLQIDMTKSADINSSIREYIRLNVLNRYKFKKIDLYIQFKDLRNQNLLRYKNNWNTNAFKEEYKSNKFQTDLAFDDSTIKINFTQEKTSKSYNFDYFFNILYEKI